MSIDREKILKHLARVMNQVAEGDERPWLNEFAMVRMPAWRRRC